MSQEPWGLLVWVAMVVEHARVMQMRWGVGNGVNRKQMRVQLVERVKC